MITPAPVPDPDLPPEGEPPPPVPGPQPPDLPPGEPSPVEPGEPVPRDGKGLTDPRRLSPGPAGRWRVAAGPAPDDPPGKPEPPPRPEDNPPRPGKLPEQPMAPKPGPPQPPPTPEPAGPPTWAREPKRFQCWRRGSRRPRWTP
jgi:hypothetical protein